MLIEALQIMRHDLLNNFQISSGYRQLGQDALADEADRKATCYLRRYSKVSTIHSPLLHGLLIVYLTRYPNQDVFNIKISEDFNLTENKERILATVFSNLMGLIGEYLRTGDVFCEVNFGSGQIPLSLDLTAQENVVTQIEAELGTFLQQNPIGHDLCRRGNTMQVRIFHEGLRLS